MTPGSCSCPPRPCPRPLPFLVHFPLLFGLRCVVVKQVSFLCPASSIPRGLRHICNVKHTISTPARCSFVQMAESGPSTLRGANRRAQPELARSTGEDARGIAYLADGDSVYDGTPVSMCYGGIDVSTTTHRTSLVQESDTPPQI